MHLGDFVVGLQGDLYAFDDNLASVVATHDIDYDSHKQKSAEGTPHPRSQTLTQAIASTVKTWRPL
jgi:hypothetical protein